MYINTYIEENKDRFLSELFELIKIPSISSVSSHKKDMYRCADAIKKLLLEAGVDRAFVIETEGNPVVYADRILNDNNLPTVLYSHKYLHIKEIYVNVSLFALQRSHSSFQEVWFFGRLLINIQNWLKNLLLITTLFGLEPRA